MQEWNPVMRRKAGICESKAVPLLGTQMDRPGVAGRYPVSSEKEAGENEVDQIVRSRRRHSLGHMGRWCLRMSACLF